MTGGTKTPLAPHEASSLKRTIDKLFDRNDSVEPGADDVVAATSFGFWVGMLSGGIPRDPVYNYETRFWQTRLHRAFPGVTINDRKALFGDLLQLKTLRNRIAHHEPITHFQHDLMLKRIRDVLTAIDASLAQYVDSEQRVTTVLDRKQDALTHGLCVL